MSTYSKRNPLVSYKNKVMPIAAFTFFLCLSSTYAQNTATGDVYSNVDTASITSRKDGRSDLTVVNPATTKITLNRTVDGFINISNSFDNLELVATGGTLRGLDTTTLSLTGGTTFKLTGGTFSGGSFTLGTNDWISSTGAVLSNVQTALISSATFEGKTIINDDAGSGGPPLPGTGTAPNASGSSGLIIQDSAYTTLTGSTLTGGNAGNAGGSGENILAIGGTGLELYNSSVVITNTDISGGAGGGATARSGYSAYASGGNAIYATNSTIEIRTGSFTGGVAGEGDPNVTLGGSGLVALGGSSITNYSGTFDGADAPSVWLENSSLTSFGGNYNGDGLYSATTGSGTNNLNLQDGNFDSIQFYNATDSGIQFVTAGSIDIVTDIYQSGGTVDITNLEDDAFNNVTINGGTMIFNQDLTLAANAFFALSNSSSKAVFQDLEIGTDSLVYVGQGTIETAGNLDVLSGTSLDFTIITNRTGTITSGGKATFGTNTTVKVDATRAGFSSGVTNITIISTSGGITGDLTTDVQLTQNGSVTGRTSVVIPTIGNDLNLIFTTLSFSNYWDATGDLALLADELEDLAPSEMNAIINNLGASQSKALVEETYFTTMNTFQVAKQGLDAAVGLSISRGTEFREQLLLPGPAGPDGWIENDWRFWGKYYGQFYHRDRDGLNPEYDATMSGGVFGMDKSFGNVLVGLSGGAGKYKIDTESDANQDMDAFQAALYSTYGNERAYLDAGLAYGLNKVDSRTAAPFSLNSSFDTQLVSGYLGGGYGFELPAEGLILTPEAAIRYTLYHQDAYDENGSLAAPRSFEEFDADSLTTSLGLNAALLNNTVLKTFAFKFEGRAHWIREFNPEPGNISYQLIGGNNDYLIAYPTLDEDTIRLGFGFTFFNTKRGSTKNVLLRLDFDELIGKDFNSHNLSAKAIFAF